MTIKCHNCDWQGREEDLLERPAGLQLYDYVAMQSLKTEVTRAEYLCPRCGTVLKSHRLIGGMVFDQ